ncbi:MAG: alginate lyase family protein [Candidatus Brocadiia bacterium]
MVFSRTSLVGVLCLFFTLFTHAEAAAGEYVKHVDLMRHLKNGKERHIKPVGKNAWEWTLPQGKSESLLFNLEDLDIDPSRYDEIRFEIKSTVSQVRTHWKLHGHLEPGQVSSWYLKFKTPTGQWREGRYSLHLDDDGVYLSKGKNPEKPAKWLKITLGPRILGYPGEPKHRRALIRNVRFVRHRVTADFRLKETDVSKNDAEVAYIYKLHLRNQTNSEQKVRFDLDSSENLHYFSVEGPDTVSLAGGGERAVPIKISIPRHRAMGLPPLYSEAVFPKIYLPGKQDSDVIPLRGYRRWPMWGSVPLFNYRTWRPAEFKAYLKGREKSVPGIAGWKRSVIRGADRALKHDWPVPDFGPPEHNQGYRCSKCKCWLKPATPTALHKHVCPKCGKVYENNEHYDRAYLLNYNSGRAGDVEKLSLAWLMTGEKKYAAKSARILLKYAKQYADMPIRGTRSTAGGARLGASTLHASYVIPVFARGYYYLREAPVLDEKSQEAIEKFIRKTGFTVVQHSVEYNNQQAEHLRAYGTVGLATEFWPLAAEAIHGEFGYHEVAEYGYSEDGIAHEGSAYHRAVFGAMNGFAQFAYGLGLNLYSARFKRVFDGSLAAGLTSTSYELAYRVYRDPSYLRRLPDREGKRVGKSTALHGVLGLPDAAGMPVRSVHMTGAGYVFLKKGNAADFREIRLNYIKQFDRHEHDRLTTFFYRNGQQIDKTVGRITYGSPHSGWMRHTAAHNCIVIDGKSEEAPRGVLVAYEPSPSNPVAVVGSDPERPFYEGVSQLRCIALVGDAYIVFDRVQADSPHTIDRYQYGRGQAKLKFDGVRSIEKELPDLPEWGNFPQIRGGTCNGKLRVDFANGLKMRLVADGDIEAYKAITQGGYQARPMEVTFTRRPQSKEATFLAGFSFGEKSSPPRLKVLKTGADALAFQVQTKEKTHTIKIDPGAGKVVVDRE